MTKINLGGALSLSGTLKAFADSQSIFPIHSFDGNRFPDFKPRWSDEWEWTIEQEYEEMPEGYAEKLSGWKHVMIEYGQTDACALWAISETTNFWMHRESEILDSYIFWFCDPKDAVYAKLTFGGAA